MATLAVDTGRRAVSATPNDPALILQFADALEDLALMNDYHGERALAVAAAQESVAVSRVMVSAYPNETAYKIRLVGALLTFGDAESGVLNLSGARAHYEEALATVTSMINAGVRDLRVLRLHGDSLHNVAARQWDVGQRALARQTLAESLRIAESVAQADTANLSTRESLKTRSEIQREWDHEGDPTQRKESASFQLANARAYARPSPGDAGALDRLALACMTMAKTHGDLGESAEAFVLIDEALGYARQLAAENVRIDEYQETLYSVLTEAAWLRARFGDVATARALREDALRVAQARHRLDPSDAERTTEVLDTMWNLRTQYQSSRVRWADIVALLEPLDGGGLSGWNQIRLALARANAAREFRR